MITNEQMTRRDKEIKECIIEMLISEGYGTYADRLKEFDLLVTDFWHGHPVGVALMSAETGEICINPDFADPTNDLIFKQLSVVVRHELLHFLLMHEQRFYDHLKAIDPDFENTYEQGYIHELANYAMDWELSDIGYDEYDKKVAKCLRLGGRTIEGLVLSEDRPEWVGKPMEELFDLVRKELEQNKQQLKNIQTNGNPGKGLPQEYADAWNAIMSKFDNSNFSDADLQDLIDQITSGQLTTI